MSWPDLDVAVRHVGFGRLVVLGVVGRIIVCESCGEGGLKECGPRLQVSLHVVHAGRAKSYFFVN
jgi:hypothetical protein